MTAKHLQDEISMDKLFDGSDAHLLDEMTKILDTPCAPDMIEQVVEKIRQAARTESEKEIAELLKQYDGACFERNELRKQLEESERLRIETHQCLSAETTAKFDLKRQLEEYRKDAERYRYLREWANGTRLRIFQESATRTELDAAIDAAIAGEKK